MDCAFLARLVAEGRLDEDEAFEVVKDLAVNLVRKAFMFRVLRRAPLPAQTSKMGQTGLDRRLMYIYTY